MPEKTFYYIKTAFCRPNFSPAFPLPQRKECSGSAGKPIGEG